MVVFAEMGSAGGALIGSSNPKVGGVITSNTPITRVLVDGVPDPEANAQTLSQTDGSYR